MAAGDETVRQHHQLNRHEFEQSLGDSERQGSLAYCSPWGCKESNMTQLLKNNILESAWCCQCPDMSHFNNDPSCYYCFMVLLIPVMYQVPVYSNFHEESVLSSYWISADLIIDEPLYQYYLNLCLLYYEINDFIMKEIQYLYNIFIFLLCELRSCQLVMVNRC